MSLIISKSEIFKDILRKNAQELKAIRHCLEKLKVT